MSTDNLYLTPFENAFTRLQGDQTNLKSKIISLLYLIYPTKNKGLKKFRITLILFFALVGFFSQAPSKLPPSQPQEFRVTLLGAGSPTPSMSRFGPGVLIQAGGKHLLIDSGRGTTQRIWQVGIKLGLINAVFITHLHSDHVEGLPDLWLTGWL